MNVAVEHLSFSYGSRQVLRDISFRLGSGQLVSLLGPNGAGKSTLLRCLLGSLRGYGGQVCIEGQDTRTLSLKALAKRMAYIPQSHAPAFHYDVLDMVLMGASAQQGPFAQPGKMERAQALEALKRVGIADLARRDYLRISGGERQLVLIARALAQQAIILLLDEPTASLDYGNQLRVLGELRRLATEGYTILQATHHPEHAYLFSDAILAMAEGVLVAQGAPGEVLTAELMETLYGVAVRVESLRGDRVRVCIPEELP